MRHKSTRSSPLKRIGVLGAGRIGLPLSLVLAKQHPKATIYACDSNQALVAKVQRARLPFREQKAQALLRNVLKQNFSIGTDPSYLASCDCLVVTLPTSGSDPETDFYMLLQQISAHLNKNAHVVICSTLSLGLTERLASALIARGHQQGVAYCPERVAEGVAISELIHLPQIISATTTVTLNMAKQLFNYAHQIILSPREAEMAKLISNAWRYAEFALANSFYAHTVAVGVDFAKVFSAIKTKYPRAASFKSPGFVGGPCLEKDTRALTAIGPFKNKMAQQAIQSNRGLVEVIAQQICSQQPRPTTVGILGMAFKKNCDDSRNSLSYALRDRLTELNIKTLCHDPFINEINLLPLKTVLAQAQLLVIGVRHDAYTNLKTQVPILNVWQNS